MLTERSIKRLVGEPLQEEHIEFLRHYLNNKDTNIFLNAVGAYFVTCDKRGSYKSAQVAGSRIVRRYKEQINKYIEGLKNLDFGR